MNVKMAVKMAKREGLTVKTVSQTMMWHLRQKIKREKRRMAVAGEDFYVEMRRS